MQGSNFIKLVIFIAIVFSNLNLIGQIQNVNPDPNGEPWIVGGARELTLEELSELHRIAPELKIPKHYNILRNYPSELDNTDEIYFPPIFNQTGGSCSQCSGVAYTFTYEINFLRGLASDVPENLYPSHFTYNFLNKGDGANGSNYTDGWQIIKEMGCPTQNIYGGMSPIGNEGWMSGYNNYYSAMSNVVYSYHHIDVSTVEGLNTLKGWLLNHLNDSLTVGGLVVFSCGSSDMVVKHLPLGTPNQTDFIVTEWDESVDHAMTFVGYNDSIRYDYNGDGSFTNDVDINNDGVINIADWEIGGMIFTNSWGTGWGDGGKSFMMYRLLADTNSIANKRVYMVEPKVTYGPDITMKFKMNHPSRKMLKINTGLSNDTSATEPDITYDFKALIRRGGDYPMTGFNDTIEFGLDITPLYKQGNMYEDTKLFIQVEERDTGNVADGSMINFSVLTYTDGIEEFPCEDSLVPFINDDITRLSVIIPGNGFYPPQNLNSSIVNRTVSLQWESPSSYPVGWYPLSYNLYRNGEFIYGTSDTLQINFDNDLELDGRYEYEVTCIYSNGTDLFESQAGLPSSETLIINPVAGSGNMLSFDGQDDYIELDSLTLNNESFSIEFWSKKFPAGGDNMAIGHGQWGKSHKSIHFGFRNNKLYCGFYGDDISTDTTYVDTDWHHYAATFDTVDYKQILYRDGEIVAERDADTLYLGVGKLYIGSASNERRNFNGNLDEIRIWNTVRSQQEIREYMFQYVDTLDQNLIGYYRFDEQIGTHVVDYSNTMNHGQFVDGIGMRPASSLWVNHVIEEDTVLMLSSGYSPVDNIINYDLDVAPQNGSVEFGLDGILTYTPDVNWLGYDSLTYTVYDNAGESTKSLYINAHNFNPIGIEENLLPTLVDFEVFPNPATSLINIHILDNVLAERNIEVYNVSGQFIQSLNTFEKIVQLDVSNLSAGEYFIRVNVDNSSEELIFNIIR